MLNTTIKNICFLKKKIDNIEGYRKTVNFGTIVFLSNEKITSSFILDPFNYSKEDVMFNEMLLRQILNDNNIILNMSTFIPDYTEDLFSYSENNQSKIEEYIKNNADNIYRVSKSIIPEYGRYHVSMIIK